MPVIIPNEYEEKWTQHLKDPYELKALLRIVVGWSPNGWVSEQAKKTDQMSLF